MSLEEIADLRERITRQAQIDDEIRRGEVVTALLDPIDSLAYAVEASENLPEATVQGLRMIHRSFVEALQKLGLEAVPGKGSTFDPSIHDALATSATQDETLEGTVAHVYSTGYRLGTRLVRPARVVTYIHRPA